MTISDAVDSSLLQHPEWVAMDIENLGKSFYTSGDRLREKVDLLNYLFSENKVPQLALQARNFEGLVNNDLRMKIWPKLLTFQDFVKTEKIDQIGETGEIGKNHEIGETSKLADISKPDEIGETGESDRKIPQISNSKLSLLSSDLIGFVLDDFNFLDLQPHKDEDQVKLDIDRSFTILSHINSLHSLQSESFTTIFSKNDVKELRKYLFNLIIKILRKYPQLNYYQGYHDIASIILLTCNIPGDELKVNEDLAFKLLEFITLCHLRDFMIKDIQLSINHLRLIPTILQVVEPNLFDILKQTSLSYTSTNGKWYDYNFYPALSSILTWYSHDLNNLQQILVIWDFIISYNSVLVNIYVYVTTLIYYKSDIYDQLGIFQNEDDCTDNIDFDMIDRDLLHSIISPTNLFSKVTDVELNEILKQTQELIEKFPLDELTNLNYTFDDWFRQYNKNSVLLTTSNIQFDNNTKISLFDDTRKNLKEIVALQDSQVLDQKTHEMFKHQYILREIEENDTMVNSTSDLDSQGSLLSSSMSLHSSTSTLNLKLVNTSLIFKKLFRTDSWKSSSNESQEAEITLEKFRNDNSHILRKNIYGISFTIGFIGFLVHYLVIRNNENMSNYNLFKSFSFNTFKKICTSIFNSDQIQFICNLVFKVSGDLLNDAGIIWNNLHQVVEESDLIHRGIVIGSVGIGNIRNTIYGFTS